MINGLEMKQQLVALCELGSCPDCGVAKLKQNEGADTLVCGHCNAHWTLELNGYAWNDAAGVTPFVCELGKA